MEINKKTYEDYKYVLQDVGNICIGAKFSYNELLHEEEIPFKIKVIAEKYLSTEIDKTTTLESHIYYLSTGNFAYECFLQLKTKIKYSMLTNKKTFWGKERKQYVTKVLPIKKFVEIPLNDKKISGIMIQEVILSKMSVMTFSV